MRRARPGGGDALIAVLSALAPIFALIALGLWLRRSGVAPEAHWMTIERLCFSVLFPALLVTTLARTETPAGTAGALAAALVLMMLGMAALMLAGRGLFISRLGIDGPAYSTLFQAGVRWNGFIALAVVLNLHGAEAAALVAVGLAALAPIGNTAAVLILERYGDQGKAGAAPAGRSALAATLRRLALNPVILACAIGAGMNALGLAFWRPLAAFLDLLGGAALGLGMLAIGAALSLRAAARPSPPALAGVALKLVAAPLLALALCGLFGVSGLAREVALICAATPMAANGFVMARQMGGDAPLYATTMTLQTAGAILALPVWIFVARALG